MARENTTRASASVPDFIGRQVPLERLRDIAAAGESAIVVVHGRPRVGKTALIEHAYGKRNLLKIEGIEGQDEPYQIQSALQQIAQRTGNPAHALIRATMPDGRPSWNGVFELLSSIVNEGVWTLYFEELQWLAAYKDTFAAELKYWWDNFFRRNARLLVVLCGSSPSFMVNHIVRSRALYNRSQHEIPLMEFTFDEARGFLGFKNPFRVLEAYLTVGGIPEHLRYLRRGASVYQALCEHSFRPGSYFAGGFDRIFSSAFATDPACQRIIGFLSRRKFATRDQVLRNAGLSPGGAATDLLNELQLCGLVESYTPYNVRASSRRLVCYAISDYYIQYYVKFIQSKLGAITRSEYNREPTRAMSISELKKWQGHAFERFCRRQHRQIAHALGFSGVQYEHGPFFSRSTDKADPGCQIDLVYDRADKTLTLCEIELTDEPACVTVGQKFREKLKLFDPGQTHRTESVLICPAGATPDLRKGGYFDRFLELEDIVKPFY